MKISVVIFVISAVFCIATAVPLPSGRNHGGLMFVQQHHPYRYYPSQQAMLVHYNQPKYASRRSSQEVAAFAAGDAVEGGTFIQEGELPTLQDGDALSIAEAYPEADDSPALLASDVPSDENNIQPENDELPIVDSPVVAPQQDAPVANVPVKKNKKKVMAAAPVEATNDEDDEYVPSITKAGGPSGQQWPHTFFPMNFGSTSGGAIAVANSYSTGKGGTATSHATAYGSPAAAKKRRND